MALSHSVSQFFGFTGGVDEAAEIVRLQRRVDALEAQVAELARSTQTDLRTATPPSPVSDEVRALALQGQPIRAIKRHREQTGLGLKTAKADIDAVVAGRL